MATTAQRNVVSDEILARCWERAPIYDKENRFFDEDFKELVDAGYLKMAIPTEFGGLGMAMPEVMRETRRLAYHAAPTALALNMHIYWTGVAADLLRAGDNSLEWLLKEAAEGKVFAAGHGESGNDIPVVLSTANAERVDGGYRFTAHKNFGSLSPVWDYLGLHAMDTSDPNAPKVVHAFMPRDTQGYHIDTNWDVLGMRATQSHDTVLEGAFIPDKYIVRAVAPGAAGVDLFILALFAWAVMGFGNVYYGLARRAFDMAIEGAKKRKSLAISRTMAYHAGVQNAVADMGIELEGIEPHLEKTAQEWADGVDHGGAWPMKLFATKYRAVEGAWKVVDTALDVAGGFGIFEAAQFERLLRDARLGKIHPVSGMLTKEFVAKTALGIDPDETPRWG